MLKSMTGFGQATLGHGKDKWVVEIRCLNHRFLEYSSKLPQTLSSLEGDIKGLVQAKIRRGKVSLAINLNGGESLREQVVIDGKKIDFYYRNLRKIAHRLKIDAKFSLSDLISLPNIFLVQKSNLVMSREWVRVRKVVLKALGRLMRMKVREGQILKRELLMRLTIIANSVARIEKVSSRVLLAYQERLKNRVEELVVGLELDTEKLAREVAIMADKSDITEEIVRLGSHLKLFRATLAENEEVGKKLDFITQEMNREANTIASKSLSFDISQEVVKIKTEIEKIREQVQNIE